MQLWKKLLCVFLVAIASGEIIEAAPRKVYAGQISAFGIWGKRLENNNAYAIPSI